MLALPWLHGARAPWWQPDAHCAFAGVTSATGPGELTRAVVESIAYDVARCIELIAPTATEVVLAGGGAQWPAETDAAAWVVPPTAGCLTTDRYWKVSDLVEVSTSQDDGAS